MRRSFYRGLVASIALVGFASSPAMAQIQAADGTASSERTEERLTRLENELRSLQGTLYSAERPQRPLGGTRAYPQGATLPGTMSEADVSIRVMQLEQSLAELTGRIEELSFKMQRQQEILKRLEGQKSPEFGAPNALPNVGGVQNPDLNTGGPVDQMSGQAPAPAVSLPDDPDLAYEEAYNAVLGAQYTEAEEKLEAFVVKFPDAPQIAEAKFTLGEIYLATGANGEAARTFLDHVSQYKDDPRSPEAYLNLGISFKRLNRPEEACRVFNAGVKKFPNMGARLAANFAAERTEASCN